jgi:hypothetical protein
MADPARDEAIYARCFASKPWGWALYKDYSTLQLKSGQCGYFDHTSSWKSIVDLADPAALKQKGYSAVHGLSVTGPEGEVGVAEKRWPVLTSEGVEGVDVGGGASVESVCLLFVLAMSGICFSGACWLLIVIVAVYN